MTQTGVSPRLRNAEAGACALLKPADPPKWLLRYLGKTRTRSGGKVGKQNGDLIPQGGRNDWLTSMAGKMRYAGFEQKSITAALIAENELRCVPPLGEAEVLNIAKSVSSYPPADEVHHRDFSHDRWPDPLKPSAFYGLAGDLVRVIEPHSEADPAALLIQFLVAFGNLIGRFPYFLVEADRHFMNLFATIVGQTAKARKGTSWGRVHSILLDVDLGWCEARIVSGLSSGEGLIWEVRNRPRKTQTVPGNANPARYLDKRVLVTEPEFARVLQVAERESNTLSAVMRQAWDTGNLRILTKKQAAYSTEAHISIIGHITRDELRRRLTDAAVGNGFANRFLWVCAKRSRLLPFGSTPKIEDLEPIIDKLKAAVGFARGTRQMYMSLKARELWQKIYPKLSEGQPGLFGSVTSRAEAQTIRLACIYALLDNSSIVRVQHLRAALAVWRYCEASARFIFGDSLGDTTADEILKQLRNRSDGMTRDQIREHFSRNKPSAEIERTLHGLREHGLVNVEKEKDNRPGRPSERWFASSAVRAKRGN